MKSGSGVSDPPTRADNFIIYGSGQGIMRVPAAGGEPEMVTRTDTTRGQVSPTCGKAGTRVPNVSTFVSPPSIP